MMLKKLRVFLQIILLLPCLCWGQASTPFVWADSVSDKRQEWVYFRREIIVKDIPQKAELNLFADSRYLLKINGVSIGTGPVRFYPEQVFFDTYDLLPYLKKGKNVIAIKVLSHGMNTFQTPRSIGGLKVWGEVKEDSQKSDFSDTQSWLCRRATGYLPDTPKMTFALGPIEIIDDRQEPDNWQADTINPSLWKAPVPIHNQKHWGEMQPRPIPFLSQQVFLPKSILGVHELSKNEDVYSFRLKTDDRTRTEFNQRFPAMAYTYLYSIRPQKIRIGLWWGKYFVNGVALKPLGTSKSRMQWQDFELELKAGWNYFLCKNEVFWGTWDFYMAVSKSDSIRVSSSQQKDSKEVFRSILLNEKDSKLVSDYNTQSPDTLFEKWNIHLRDESAQNPVWDMAWQTLDRKINLPSTQAFPITFHDSTEKAILIDLGQKQLGRIIVQYEAPEGTQLDLGYTEDLLDNRAYVLKRSQMYLGSRHISKGGLSTFETFHPYGLRYLQINIRNHKGKPIVIHKIGVVSETYPFQKIGSFECSDSLLTSIWKMGWRTLQVCSEDVYIDTPFRERGVYAGDALPEYAITLSTTNDSRLMKHSLFTLWGLNKHLFAPNTKEHPDGMFGNLQDFPHLMIQELNWYYARTKSIDEVRRYYSGYKYFLQNCLKTLNPDGTYTNRTRAFIEWTTIEKNEAELTPLHIFMAESCRILANWAKLLHQKNDMDYFNTHYKTLSGLIQTKFWDEKLGTYHDGYKNGMKLGTAFPISGALAILYGIATPEQTPRIVSYIEKELNDIGTESRRQKTSPYGSFYILQALYQQQRSEIAERFIKEHWGKMTLKYNDTAWENFDDVGIGTLSHAWSAHPTYFLTTEALGFQMEFPNKPSIHNEITLSPQSETLTWAKGTVWHPKGLVSIEWRVENNILYFNYSAPSSLKIKVKPKGRLANFKLVTKHP
jgi:alpha-L-rhamnosidase